MTEARPLRLHPVGNHPDIAYALSDVLDSLTETPQDDFRQWLGGKTCPELADGNQGIYIAHYRQWLTDRFQRTFR